jgi:hypothetical protein
MTPINYASYAGTLKGCLTSLKYNREISNLFDNDAVKLKAFQAIIDASLETANKHTVREEK